MKAKSWLILLPLFFIYHAFAQDAYRNVISTAPFSPLFGNVQLDGQHQIDSLIALGALGRYYFGLPASSTDTADSHGGDVTIYAKLKSRKEPGGFYVIAGIIAGYYHTMAGYGYEEQAFLWGTYDVITHKEQRDFFTCGAKFMFGYEVLINHLSLDFSLGVKGMSLPSTVTDPVDGKKLIDVWGTERWSSPYSPGSILQMGIMMGYRF